MEHGVIARNAVRFRAVLLDLGDTIFALGPVDRPAIERGFAAVIAEEAGLTIDGAGLECGRVMEALRSNLRRDYDTGVLTEPRIADVALTHLRHFGAAAEVLALRLGELIGAADAARFMPAPDCAARVLRLRDAGLRVGVVSNTTTSPSVLTTFLERIGLAQLTGAIAYSVEVGFRKPHPAIYRVVLDRLEVVPQDAVFVGDRVLEDVLGPREIGMEAVLTHEFRQEPPGDSAPLAVIASLGDLPALLD